VKKNYTRVPVDQPNPIARHETAIWLPLLSIRVCWNHKQTPRIPVVLDSGSQYCLFRADIAGFLGLT
jgi:hypothetical protein